MSRVDVHVVDLRSTTSGVSLSAGEQARAGRMVDPVAAVRWMTARKVLRAILAAASGGDPEDLVFEIGPHGKPRLAGGPEFNLTHTADLALVAVCRDAAVGIDAEAPRAGRDVEALAARVLPPEAAREVAAEPDGERRAACFLRAWVRHEALVKCLGTGLGSPAPPAGEVHVADLRDPAPGVPAALAVAGGVAPRIEYRELP